MIKYISHRGNLNGPNPTMENNPDYIKSGLDLGYDVEIDMRIKNKNLYLGHDTCDYLISEEWLKLHSSKLWIHAKDGESALWLQQRPWAHYFCHENDRYTITSKNWLWCHDWQNNLNLNCVIPLLSLHDIDKYQQKYFGAVCTDYVYDALKKFKGTS